MGGDYRSTKLRKLMRTLQRKLTTMIYNENNISPPKLLYKSDPPGWKDVKPYVKFQSICNAKQGGEDIFKNLFFLFRKTVKRIPTDLLDVLNCYKELTENKTLKQEREKKCLDKIDLYLKKLDTEKTMEKIPNDKLDDVFLHILHKYTEKVEKEQNPPSDKILDSVYKFLDSVEQIQKNQDTHSKTVKRKPSSNDAFELPAKRKKPSRIFHSNKCRRKSQPSIYSNYCDHKGIGKGVERRKRTAQVRRKAIFEDTGNSDGIENCAEKRTRNSQPSHMTMYEDITDDEGSVDSDISKHSTSPRAADLDISNIMFCSERGIHSSSSYDREQAMNQHLETIPQKTVPYVSSDSDSDAENSKHKRLSYTSTDVMFGHPGPDESEEITYETTDSDNNQEEKEEENYTKQIFQTFPLSEYIDWKLNDISN